MTEERPADSVADALVPIAEASVRLRRSVWTLKRYFAKGWLPVAIIGGCWFIPESFIRLVWASMRPREAANFAECAEAWFVTNGYAEAGSARQKGTLAPPPVLAAAVEAACDGR